tara:strand:- start:429 stop:542 length:114 start_codon:yes stop_codon:yes gene_type:complete
MAGRLDVINYPSVLKDAALQGVCGHSERLILKIISQD